MIQRPILRSGELELELSPAAGGSIARFERVTAERRQPMLRGARNTAAGPLDSGCFPLVPFCNRIRAGRFSCDGRQVVLQPNMPPDPSPLHGQGWLIPWHVTSASGGKAEIRVRHEAGEWPWSWEAVQRFSLDDRGLSVELSCRNLSDERMPCGLGLHPYYPCDSWTRLDTRVENAWTIDADVLPVAPVPAEGRYDLHNRRICGQNLDNGFTGWNGKARIAWSAGAAGLQLSSPNARYFQVYSPEEGGLFVAEPVQHANAALNEPQESWRDLGIELLAPGNSRQLHVRFDVILPDNDHHGSAAT